MYKIEGKICGFKDMNAAKETFFICFDKSQVYQIDREYFVPAVSAEKTGKPKDLINALEVKKQELPKEVEKYIREVEFDKDWLKNYIGKRITIKFDKIPGSLTETVKASEVLFID